MHGSLHALASYIRGVLETSESVDGSKMIQNTAAEMYFQNRVGIQTAINGLTLSSMLFENLLQRHILTMQPR